MVLSKFVEETSNKAVFFTVIRSVQGATTFMQEEIITELLMHTKGLLLAFWRLTFLRIFCIKNCLLRVNLSISL